MRRHLQDQHSGVGFQCDVCGLLFNRRDSKHACNGTEQDMVYIHRESGVFGEEAHQLLVKFINERQDREWQYIEKEETEKETPHITSDPPIIPTRRKESRKPPSKSTYNPRRRSPTPLEEPEIDIEKPPRKRRRKVEAILKDLETSSSSSSESSSLSESDSTSSDSEDDDDERKLRHRNRGSLVLENHNKEKDVSDKIRKEKDERIVKMKETRKDERSKKDVEQDSDSKENNEITPCTRQTETEVQEMISGQTKETNLSADLENNKVNVEDNHYERQDGEDRVIENKKQNAKQSEDENNNQNVNVNELTCESKGVEKQCIYEGKDRDKSDNNKGSAILDTIMDEMTATFSQTHTSNSDKETENAVLSIIDKSNNTEFEASYDVVSECTYELVKEIIINSEIENAVEKVNGNLEQKRTIPEKRKLDRTDLHQEPREKKRLKSVDRINDKEMLNLSEKDEDLETIEKIQGCRVILNIGGVRFETSILTLRKDPNSLLAKLFTKESSFITHGSIFIDRDASHFKVILNYLRYDRKINSALLPRERRHLLELKKECEYYRLPGLRDIVIKRMEDLADY